jgi:energy-coupling factor transporter ATP-binding protein EcfA2
MAPTQVPQEAYVSHQPHYDVFLSHNRADAAMVELLARRLRDESGLHPFLDTWHLVPGEPWQEGLEAALSTSGACAVFLGAAGLGTWDNEAMRAALEQRVENPEFRVLPVLLPAATLPERGKLPPFLARLTWVDFRGGLDDEAAFHALVSGVKGVAPGATEAATVTECPFRGLQVFEEEHAAFFFGREALTQHLLEELRADRFLAVVGPSGSGKSSLVRAGLVPQVRQGALAGSAEWPVVVFRPGPYPLDTLATRLLPLLGPAADPLAARETLARTLAGGERGLHTSVQTILAAAPESRRLLLVVDQFEELFTLCHDAAARRAFIDALLYAATIAGGQTVAVITMRADFLGRAAAEPGLAARLKGLELVGPMDAAELRRAMIAPAEKVGLRYERGLVETILDDLGDEPGSLPLLQHTLLELWERRRGGWLTTDAYHTIGGVRGALAARAEAIFTALTPAQKEAARRVLLRLTQPGEGTEDTRRRAPLSELLPAGAAAGDIEAAVSDLAGARLLTISSDEAAKTQAADAHSTADGSATPLNQSSVVVDVSHEALIRGWPRLQSWISADREALRTHRQLTEAAEAWEDNGRETSYLFSGARLATAVEWAQNHAGELNALEQAFLDASIAAREIEARARRRRTQTTIAGLAAALGLVSLALVAALLFWQQSERNARLARAQYLATEGQLRAPEEPLLGLRLALEGLATVPSDDSVLRERIARNVVFPLASTARLARLPGDVANWHVSADRTMLLLVRADHSAELVQATDGESLPWRADGSAQIEGVAFFPNGNGFVVRYKDAPGALVQLPGAVNTPLPAVVEGVHIAPQGDYFVLRYRERPAELRRLGEPAFAIELGENLESVSFSPRGEVMVADYRGANGRLLRVADGTLLAELDGVLEGSRVRFSPDGATLAVVYEDKRAELRRAADGTLLKALMGKASRLTWTPAGTRYLVEYDDHTAELFESAGNELLVRLDGDVDKVLLSPDEDLFVVDYNDRPGEVRRVSDPALAEPLAARIGNVTFGQGGALLIIDYDDRLGELRQVRAGTTQQLRGVVERVMAGPDGMLIVRYENTAADLIDTRFPERPVGLGSGTRDFVFLPGNTSIAALYRDGSAYLLDAGVLRALAAGDLVNTPAALDSSLCSGILAGSLWRAPQEAAWREYLAGAPPMSCGGRVDAAAPSSSMRFVAVRRLHAAVGPVPQWHAP